MIEQLTQHIDGKLDPDAIRRIALTAIARMLAQGWDANGHERADTKSAAQAVRVDFNERPTRVQILAPQVPHHRERQNPNRVTLSGGSHRARRPDHDWNAPFVVHI